MRKGNSNQKLFSLKRARKEVSVGFDGLNYIGAVDSAHRVEKNSLRSNSFSTVPMDMGMSGCSKPLGEETTSFYDI